MKDEYNGIIEKLKNRRSELDMSYQELADKTGISKSTLQRYETGSIKNIPLSKIKVLSFALGVSPAYIIGSESGSGAKGILLPVVGTVKAGYDALASGEHLGTEPAYGVSPDIPHVWLRIKGDSMAPDIKQGDLALVRLQSDVDDGDVAVVFINGDEGTIKKINKHKNAVSLVPLNPAYETKVLVGSEMNDLVIYGKVVEIKRKY